MPDGKYILEVSVSPVAEGVAQKKSYNITVDRIAPEVELSSYNETSKEFNLKLKEDLSGIREVKAYFTENKEKKYLEVKEANGEYVINTSTAGNAKELKDIYLYVQDWAGNVYDYPLSDSLRGNGRTQVIVRTKLNGEGTLPNYEVKVYDEAGAETSPYKLTIGKRYRLVTKVLDVDYELEGKEEEYFIPTEENSTVIIEKVFRKIKYFTVRTYVKTEDNGENYTGPIRIKLTNLKTKEEFILNKDTESSLLDNIYVTTVKRGEYKIEAENVTAGWKANFRDKYTPVTTITVDDKKGYIGGGVSVNLDFVKEKKPQPELRKVYLNLAYDDEYKEYAAKSVTFVFKDSERKEYEHIYGGPKDTLIQLPDGKNTVAIKNLPDWKLDVKSLINGVVTVEKKGFWSNITVAFSLKKASGSGGTNPSEPLKPSKPVGKGSIWFRLGALNEYKDYNSEKPIIFILTNKKTKEKITHKFASVADYKVEFPYGEYVISANVEGYNLEIAVVKDNTVVLNEKSTGNREDVIFVFKKNGGVLDTKKYDIYLTPDAENEYKDFVVAPVDFVFTDESGKTYNFKYSGKNGDKAILPKGKYKVSLASLK